MHMLTLNFNKKGPYSRRGFRNELNLLEQIFCEYLQSAAYQSVFIESEPTMNYSPYWRLIYSNLDKALSKACFLQCHRARSEHAND